MNTPYGNMWNNSTLVITQYEVESTTVVSNLSSNDTADVGGYTLTESIFIAIVLGIIILFAIVGNILVCIAIFTDRKLKKFNNLLLVSLAVADLLVAITVMTFAVANDITNKWSFGAVFCNIWISFDIMCSTASILNLCAISLDRYIHIKDPYKYERKFTWKVIVFMIAIVWILSLMISQIPIHAGWHKNPTADPSLPDDMCIFELNATYAVVSSMISFYIPCIVMLAIYCRLYMYARMHVQSIKRTQTVERMQNSQGGKHSNKVSDHKAAVTLGVIVGVFLFCWLPFFIFNIVASFCGDCVPPLLFKILTWLGYSNSFLNPIIYSIFNSEFREAFKRILLPQSCIRRYNGLTQLRSPVKNKKPARKTEYISTTVENGNSKCLYGTDQTLIYSEKVTAL